MAQDQLNSFRFSKMLKNVGHSNYSHFEDYEHHYYDVMVTPFGQLAKSKTSSLKRAMVTIKSDDVYNHMLEEISIIPTLLISGTPEFRAMDISQRKCLFPSEKKLVHFDEYSQANCYLECAWMEGQTNCSFVPWKWFLRDKFPESNSCWHFGNTCFKNIFSNRFDNSRCSGHCLDDCETIEYEISLKSALVFSPENCGKGLDWKWYLFKLCGVQRKPFAILDELERGENAVCGAYYKVN